MPQFNWAVLGPIVVLCAVLVGAVFFLGSHLPHLGAAVNNPPSAQAAVHRTATAISGVILSGRVIGTPHVRSIPNSDATVLRDLQSGQVVTVTGCTVSCAWYLVSETNQAPPGWVSSAFIEVQGDDKRLPVLR